MPVTPAEFWSERDEDETTLPPLTPDGVAAAERILNVTLPPGYIDLLRVRNGGETRGWECPMQEGDWAEYVGELLGVPTPTDADSVTWASLEHDPNLRFSVLVTPYMTREWQLPPRQVLLAGDGHTWLSLDYRESDDPRVIYLQDDGDDFSVSVLADTFEQFLAKLRPGDDD